LRKTFAAIPAICLTTLAVFILFSPSAIAQAQGSSATGNHTASASAAATAPPHTITLKFDYDFSVNSACTAKKPTKVCVSEFEVYNLTDKGQRTKLFTIKAPDGATGMLKITGKSDPLPLAPGQHMLAVAAVSNTGKESDTYACTTMIDIKQ
jgi:hypothetical protein